MGFLDKECKGCNLSDIHKESCFTKPQYTDKNKKTYQCPCLNCLVKVMCTEICQDYQSFKSDYWSTLHNIIMDKHISRRKPIIPSNWL